MWLVRMLATMYDGSVVRFALELIVRLNAVPVLGTVYPWTAIQLDVSNRLETCMVSDSSSPALMPRRSPPGEKRYKSRSWEGCGH